jgi:hypothetical protein
MHPAIGRYLSLLIDDLTAEACRDPDTYIVRVCCRSQARRVSVAPFTRSNRPVVVVRSVATKAPEVADYAVEERVSAFCPATFYVLYFCSARLSACLVDYIRRNSIQVIQHTANRDAQRSGTQQCQGWLAAAEGGSNSSKLSHWEGGQLTGTVMAFAQALCVCCLLLFGLVSHQQLLHCQFLQSRVGPCSRLYLQGLRLSYREASHVTLCMSC